MVFPKDMIERYTSSGNDVSCFSLEESVFVFVQTVDCYIHSKSLERVGCSFVDCPGLFASDYDTSIAVQTMCATDATLYLLGGEKQMGQEDDKSINEIIKIGKSGDISYVGNNVFFAINQRKSEGETSFVNYNLAEIKRAGFKTESLPLYNAYLYYYAQIGKSFLDGTLDDETYDKFMSEAKKNQNFSERWIRMVNKGLQKIDLDEDYKIDELSYETAALIKRLSRAENLFSSIEDYIVGKKSFSILVNNGAIKVYNSLSAIEESLREKEKSAQLSVAAKANEFQRARDEYQRYRSEVESTIDSAFPKKDSRIYLEDSYRDYFMDESIIEEAAFKCTVNLIDFIKKGETKWRGLLIIINGPISKERKIRYEKQFIEDIKPLLTEAFSTSITPVITKWITTLYAGSDARFDDTVRERAMELGKKFKKTGYNYPRVCHCSMNCPSLK